MKHHILISAIVLTGLAGCADKSKDQANRENTEKEIAPATENIATPLVLESKPVNQVIETDKATLQPPEQPIENEMNSVTKNPEPQIGRSWTSTDGRIIQAELIARTIDTATIRRNIDKREFTIPITTFSEADREYINSSNIPLTHIKKFDTERLADLKKNIPRLTAHAPLESSFPSITDIFNKYKRSIESVSPTGFSRSIDMIKADIASDLKRLEPIAATNLKSPPRQSANGGWVSGSGAWKEVWAAKSAITWLKGPLTDHISELEKLN